MTGRSRSRQVRLDLRANIFEIGLLVANQLPYLQEIRVSGVLAASDVNEHQRLKAEVVIRDEVCVPRFIEINYLPLDPPGLQFIRK